MGLIQWPGLSRATCEGAWLRKDIDALIEVLRYISEFLVRAHDGGRAALLQSNFVGREKNLMQRLVLDVSGISAGAKVNRKVLDLRHQALTLNAVDLSG